MKMSSGVYGCNSSHRTNDVYYRKLQYVYKISKYQNVFHSKICFGNKELQKISGYEKKNMMPIEAQRHPVKNFNKISSHEIFLKNLSFKSQLNSCL